MFASDESPTPGGATSAIAPLTPRSLDAQTARLLAAATGAPDFILPWLDRFYAPEDASLVLAAHDETPETLTGVARPVLARAVRRAVLDESDDGLVTPSSFHARFEMWAFFEGWRDLPDDVRFELNRWELASYIEDVGAGVEAVRDGRPAEGDQADYTFLLLDEAEDLLRAQKHLYLWPCNCRAMWRNCEKPLHVCLRFGNARNLGWELTHERAIEILRKADAAGLMHTAYLDSSHGGHGICNCCNDCCFPILASRELGAEASWPVRRHAAHVDPEKCSSCVRCSKRCPFDAILRHHRGDGEWSPAAVDAQRCRGCGLCATSCSSEAIAMVPLPAPVPVT
jgi:Pyruvate/2-oxoacid:ferredoxin oxidoreductase delta subunit